MTRMAALLMAANFENNVKFILPDIKILTFLILGGLTCSSAFSQVKPGKDDGLPLMDKLDKYNENAAHERLFLHFDKPYYTVGDTIWFKGYIVNSTLGYSPLSSRLYADLINDSNKVVKSFIFPTSAGLSIGSIYLDEKLIPEGNYTLRAYTRWMCNFGPDNFFYASFYVAAARQNTWLINAASSLSANRVKVNLKFSGLNKQVIGTPYLQVKLTGNKKMLNHENVQMAADGNLNLDFDLPPNTPFKNLSLVIHDKNTNNTEMVPISVARPLDVDVQFMPEGGPLITLLPAHVGFKAINGDGRGINVKGVLIDGENNEELTFESLHNGMGVFDFVPRPGETYKVKIVLPSGDTKVVSLPEIKSSGTLLKIKNAPGSDSLEVSVYATKDIGNNNAEYTLIGLSRESTYYAGAFKLNKAVNKLYIPNRLFPTGVAHFCLFNMQGEAINERLCFIDHHDNLKIEARTSAIKYSPRDSIPIHITVKDEKGNPVAGSFSLSVTDDGQIKKREVNSANIFTQLLLTSDLKGYIEDPAWYFTSDVNAAKALDILLLTQGWVGYDWKKIINQPAQPGFAAEPEYVVKGKVTNLINKPLPDLHVTLLNTGKVKLFKDTITDAGGQFTFKNFPLITDNEAFVLQARKAKGRIINSGISIDENKTPPVILPYRPAPIPWYVNSDSTGVNYVKKSSAYRDELEDLKNGPGSHLLKTVTIRGKAVIKGSRNLNGDGNYDQSITQDEIEKAGKVTLLQLIRQKVNGFNESYGRKGSSIEFKLKEKRVHFSIDGVDIDNPQLYDAANNILPTDHYNYQKGILEYFRAEDITGIEVIYSTRLAALYNERNLPTESLLADTLTGRVATNIAYLEITTRSGQGPFANRANGIYVFKPAPVTIPARFYRPVYPVKTVYPGFTDLRSTIHWEPNIITNRRGEATTYFYAADSAATYTIVLQGTDLNGKVGYTIQTITIAAK